MTDEQKPDGEKNEWKKKYGYIIGELEGPAVWTDPELPSDYTYYPVDTEALKKLLPKIK